MNLTGDEIILLRELRNLAELGMDYKFLYKRRERDSDNPSAEAQEKNRLFPYWNGVGKKNFLSVLRVHDQPHFVMPQRYLRAQNSSELAVLDNLHDGGYLHIKYSFSRDGSGQMREQAYPTPWLVAALLVQAVEQGILQEESIAPERLEWARKSLQMDSPALRTGIGFRLEENPSGHKPEGRPESGLTRGLDLAA